MALTLFKHPVPARERAFATNWFMRAAPPQLIALAGAGVPAAVSEIDPRLLAILETAVYQLWFCPAARSMRWCTKLWNWPARADTPAQPVL